MEITKRKGFYPAVIILGWILLIIIINPLGEFPFGDDWAYAGPVKHFLNTGEIRITDWSSMTLLAWIYIGAFASWLFGFSFTVLRITALITAIAGTLGTYYLFTEFNIKKFYAFIGSMTLAFHPAFFILSFTFVTDTPFYAFFIWSLVCFIRFMKNEKAKGGNKKAEFYFIAACLFSLIAVLIRDLAIILPVAFAIGYFFRTGFNKKSILRFAIPAVLIWGAFFVFRIWLEAAHGVPRSMDFSRKKMLTVWTSGFGYLTAIYGKNILYSTIYSGLYASPVILVVFYNRLKSLSIKFKSSMILSTGIIATILMILVIKVPKIFHQIEYMLTNHVVLHTFTFPDVNNPAKDEIFYFPYFISILFILTGLALGIIMLFMIYAKVREYLKENKGRYFAKRDGTRELITFVIISYIGIMFSQMIIERYLTIPIILSGLLLINNEKIKKAALFPTKIVIGLAILFMAYSSICATHDMMAFNRARYAALDYLNNIMKIPPDRIDGGFEYNAWYFYDYNYKQKPGMNWWWVQNNDYIVSWGKCRNYPIIKEYEYTRWYPPGFRSKLYIGKRNIDGLGGKLN